jgi:hypothetical protein
MPLPPWHEDPLDVAAWALQCEDLRHRFIYASNIRSLSQTPGISEVLETAATLRIYEAYLSKKNSSKIVVEFERPYPGKKANNPKRVDLAIKESGKGKNWAYIECKQYTGSGKTALAGDIEKLNDIVNRLQRWLLVFRVRASGGRSKSLPDLLSKNFTRELALPPLVRSFATVARPASAGVCEICLVRLK